MVKPYSLQNKKTFKRLNEEEKEFTRNINYHETLGRADPVYFAERHLGLTLHQGQKNYLRFSDPLWILAHPKEVAEFNATHKNRVGTGHKNILNPSNRWGKTVVIAVKHIRSNYYKLGINGTTPVWLATRYQTLGISPHSSQIDAVYNYIIDILQGRFPIIPYSEDGSVNPHSPKRPNKCNIDFYLSNNKSKRMVEFKDHTYFYGASTGEDQGGSLAGKPYGYISYDECVLSHHLRDELFGRIFSRTMDWNAPIDLVSTADVDAPSQQFFYHLVRNADKGENEWYIQHGVLDDNIFLDENAREGAKKKLLEEDPQRYLQVVEGKFISSGTKAFDGASIDNIWTTDVPAPLRKDLPNPINASHEYILSVDWGFADTGDPTIIVAFDISTYPYELVYHLAVQGGNPTICLGTLQALSHHFNSPDIIMDTNALGGVIIKKMLKDIGIKVYDFTSHGGEKADAMFRLKILLLDNRQEVLENGNIVEKNPNYGGLRSYYIPKMEDQLSAYELEDKRLEQDYVIVLMQFAWYTHKRSKIKETKTYTIGKRNVTRYEPKRFFFEQPNAQIQS